MTEDWKDRLRERQQLCRRLQFVSDAVHSITGKTNQTILEICHLFPDHPDVVAFRLAEANLEKFDADH